MFTPTLRCECAQPARDRLMRKWCIPLKMAGDLGSPLFTSVDEHVMIAMWKKNFKGYNLRVLNIVHIY